MSKHLPVNRGRRTLLAAAGVLTLQGLLQAPTALAQAAAAPKSSPQPGGKTKIGIVGSGHIGGTVGSLWVKAGHPVFFSSRHPEQLQDLVKGLGSLAQAGTVEQALAFGDVIFVAVPYGALPELGKDHAKALAGKVVLDACNAVAKRDGAIADEVEKNGIGVTTQKYLPGTHVVRAFNSINYKLLASESNRAAPRLGVPLAGDDAHALEVAAALVQEAGFDPVIVGKLIEANRFHFGGPGFGAMTAAELKQKLSVK